MKSRRLPPRQRRSSGPGKRERLRRLAALGLSSHDDEEVQREALAVVERFRRWTNHQRCAVTGWRTGEAHEFEGIRYLVAVEWAHVLRTRGAYGFDFGGTLPLVDLLHRRQEHDAEFFARRGLDVVQLARAHAMRFFEEHADDAGWILVHAADGDAIALAGAAVQTPATSAKG